MAEASSPRANTNGGSPLLIVNLANQINSIKLSDDNFLSLNLQVLAGIRGLGLDLFILDNPPVPSQIITDDKGAEILNPSFMSWFRQDQLLFSFLLASMTEGVQGQMIGCLTSSQLWSRISRLFASRSKAKAMQYKFQLQTLKKGNLSMKDYLGKMKNLIDILAACGHLISEDDQILHVLGGIGLEYDSVVVHVTSRVDSLLLSDVAALLLAHEARIDSYTPPVESPSPSAHTTTFRPSSKSYSRPPNSGSPFQGRGRGRHFRGGRRGWNNNSGRPVCQICGVSGHIAEKCYYRFDTDFVPLQRSSGNSSSTTPRSFHSSSQSPVAAVACSQTDPPLEEWWYPDSEASHHVTSDLGNLSLASDYSGTGKVHIDNGEGSSNSGGASSRQLT